MNELSGLEADYKGAARLALQALFAACVSRKKSLQFRRRQLLPGRSSSREQLRPVGVERPVLDIHVATQNYVLGTREKRTGSSRDRRRG